MKNRKLLLTLLCITMSIFVAFGMVACAEHTEHDYGSSFKSSATQHWKECSCGEKNELSDHTFDEGKDVTPETDKENIITEYTCTVCGYKKTDSEIALTNVELFEGFTSSLVNFENGNGYNINFDLDATIGGQILELYDGENYIPYDIDHTIEAKIEFYIGKTTDGELDFKGVLRVYGTAYKMGTEEVFAEEEASATFILDGTKLYAKMVNKEIHPNMSEELKEYNDYENINSQVIDIKEDAPQELDVLYTILPEIIDFAQEKVVPAIELTWAENAEEIVDFIFKSVENVYEITSAANGYTLSFDFDKLIEGNTLVYEKTVSELYDVYNGEGAFAALEEQVIAFMDITVEDIVNSIFREDFTVTALKNEVQTILTLLYPEETPTIEDVFGEDIFTTLNNVNFREKTICELIAESAGSTKSEVKEQVREAFASIRDVKLYDVIYEYIENSEDIHIITDKEQTKDILNKLFEFVDTIADIKISLDKKGAFKEAAVDINVTDEQILEFAKYINDVNNGDDAEVLSEGEESTVVLPYDNLEVKGNIKLSIGAYQNVHKVDFDSLISEINEEAID